MGFFSRLFGRQGQSAQETTVDRPFVIKRPRIGFLNLLGERGVPLLEHDRRELAPLFRDALTSSSDVPRCEVLFLYCDIEATGKVRTSTRSLREIFKDAGAYIAVVASENDFDALQYAIEGDEGWSSNIVLVVDRKGDRCAAFFRRLFELMRNRTSMLMAWVELAPQIPGYEQHDVPESIMLAEAGHIAF